MFPIQREKKKEELGGKLVLQTDCKHRNLLLHFPGQTIWRRPVRNRKGPLEWDPRKNDVVRTAASIRAAALHKRRFLTTVATCQRHHWRLCLWPYIVGPRKSRAAEHRCHCREPDQVHARLRLLLLAFMNPLTKLP